MSAPFQLSFFRAELGAMRRFETKQIKEAIAYAQAGGQALHVWEPGSCSSGRKNNANVEFGALVGV